MKCVDCPDYKACRRQNDLRRKRHKCKKANEPFVQTNADRIRAMSDEELADFIQHIRTNTLLAEALGVPVTREKDLDFVRQPVKDGDSE